ncbi:MAG: insulinase family protein [Rhodospirillales bacterium]|nr:insulinase family protein [Rhodospirillales bacterium]
MFFAAYCDTASGAVFNPETFTLGNGMQVVVVSNHRVPVVVHMVWYKVGSADEAPGKSGVAHFFEHLMFKGTPKFPNGIFSQTVARNGGQENAFTSTDYTAYFQTVAKDRLEIVMEMEADRMTNLVLTPEQVEPERQVILEERGQRVENNPGSILSEHVGAALFLNHPFRRPVIGWEHEIRALSMEDITQFYKRWYAPNNAILVVAGDITADELRPLAEKYYGGIPRGPELSRTRPQEPPHRAARQVELRDARVKQPSWSRVFLAPSHFFGEAKHVYPLEVLSDILGGGATSRLYRDLVIEKKLAVSAGAFYGSRSRGPARFGVYASPRPGVSMADIETAVENVLAELRKSGVTDDEVTRAKARVQAQAVYARDSLRAGAQSLGSALATGLSVEDVENWPERIEAVSRPAIEAALAAVMVEGASVTARLLPTGEEK